MGSTRTTNLGLLFILVLSSCGRIFDAPSFFVKAQEGSDSAANVFDDSSNNSVAEATEGPVPVGTPSGSIVSESATASDCPIDCANGSVCKLGVNDFSFFPKEDNHAEFTFLQTKSRQGWYCDCPAGFTGLRCSREYEICPLASNINSSTDAHFCFHGGTCIEGLTDGSHDTIDSSQRFCDCNSALHNDVPYFGKYCEIEGAIRCSEDSEEYCTSQGQCKEDFATKFTPCDCRVGHRGPHCEFMRGSVPNCTLACGGSEDGDAVSSRFGGLGQCKLGIKAYENARYEDFWSDHDENYQYCDCPTGWFGDNCEIPGIKCGGAHCFNGGSCLESLNKNGDVTNACDCRDAGHDGKSWAGQYCENPETSSCNAANGGSLQHANGHLFCTNGGTCKDTNNPHLGCDCPVEQFGPSCEFRTKEEAQCSLQCQNGGGCRSGMKDNSLIQQLGKGIDGFNATHHSELFEHCVCPHNFFGIQCEHSLEICPGGDHVCLHGSECKAQNEGGTTGEKHYTCNCDTAFDSLEKYAGKFCQYSSTDICTINGQPGMGKANFAFCVNNGMCKGKVNDGEDPPGCTCPDGFYGDHCEYLEEEKEQDAGKFDGDDDGFDDSYKGDGDDDYFVPIDVNNPAIPVESRKNSLKNQGVVVGLSAAVVFVVLVFIAVILRALTKKGSSYVKHDEETSSNPTNTSGIIHSSSGDGSLEDIEVDDYVNNHSNIISDSEMTNVQIV